MKNSDMKVIAIILSIALLFTIITSNAVSVVSVITLLKGGQTVTTDGAQTDDAGATNNGGSTSTTPGSSSGSTSTPGSSSGSTSTPGSSSGSTSTPGSSSGSSSGSTATPGTDSNSSADSGNSGDANQAPDANAPQNGGNATGGDDAILADPFGAYSKAANDIHTNAVAGYKKIGWQAVEGDLQLSKFSFLAGTLTSLIAGFMTEKDAAEVKDNPKGSDDAKNRMPASTCSASYIKEAKAVKDGDNYVITIVMNDQVNPSYDDTDGLQKMSKEFLDIKDVIETVATDETVSKVVSKVDGTIEYKAYTITATMNAQGQFIKIVHYGVGYINADVSAVAVGDLQASGALSFNAEYFDFVY